MIRNLPARSPSPGQPAGGSRVFATAAAIGRGLAILAVLASASCSPDPRQGEAGSESSSLVIYSGRGESLVAELLDSFEEASGVKLEVRYGGTSELAATILEEGEKTPADVFLSQDAAALGALSGAGRLLVLPDELLLAVPERYRSSRKDWVGLSGRARTLVYEPARIAEGELPRALAEVGAERFRGRFGVAPTNGSFQAHMAVYRVVNGADALDSLLAAMASNDAQAFPKNSAIVEGVIAGEIDFGLVNHYYLWRAKQENAEVTALNYLVPEGEASGFVNVAGVGVLSSSPDALALVEYLLSEPAQTYFAQKTFEYPLVEAVPPAVELLPLGEVRSPDVDFAKVSDAFEETLAAIDRSGLIR